MHQHEIIQKSCLHNLGTFVRVVFGTIFKTFKTKLVNNSIVLFFYS